MSLHKAIKSGKEHRVEYGTKSQPYCKSVSKLCRNHGACGYCYDTRTYKDRMKKKSAEEEIKKCLLTQVGEGENLLNS